MRYHKFIVMPDFFQDVLFSVRNPKSSRSVRSMKRKWRIGTVNMFLLLPIKQQITSSWFEKDTSWIKYLLSIFYFIHPCHMILSKQKCCLLLNGVSTESKKPYLCTSDKEGFFSCKKYDSYKCWTCTELCEGFTFLMENIFVKFDGIVYQQIMGNPLGTNSAPLIA